MNIDKNQITELPLNEEEEIYKENIIDHYKDPRNFGHLDNHTVSHKEVNTLCGDEIELMIKTNPDNTTEIKFKGTGCAISLAAASILTETIKNKTIAEIKTMNKEYMLSLLGIPISAVRMKCALLSLITLQKTIHKIENDKKSFALKGEVGG